MYSGFTSKLTELNSKVMQSSGRDAKEITDEFTDLTAEIGKLTDQLGITADIESELGMSLDDLGKYLANNASVILRAYGVTIFATVVGTIMSVLVCGLYGYAISRNEFKWRKQFTFLEFFTMLFGGGLVPWYLVCTRFLHINDTIWALILPMVNSAWNIIILKTFFKTGVPDAIVESARIDGAFEFKIFFQIVWPIALPGLATIALFAMLGYWNDYNNALYLTSSKELQNLQLYLFNILQNIQALTSTANTAAAQAGHTLAQMPKESARMAMCVVSVGPIILAYPFFQKYFIQGLTIGSVKG
jgi:putative aldouronate transport system permease protein